MFLFGRKGSAYFPMPASNPTRNNTSNEKITE
jgi:hypothetical protein